MSYAGKININSTDYPIASTLYKVCTTAADVTPKIVPFAEFDTLLEGVMIAVKFENTNTAVNPQLQVGSTTAKIIYTDGINPVGDTPSTSWPANSVVLFVYDGSVWRMINTSKALRTEMLTADSNLQSQIDTVSGTTIPAVEKKCLSRKGSVYMAAGSWSGSGPWTQTVTVSGLPTGDAITTKSAVSLQPNATALNHMVSIGCAAIFVTNNNGTLTATAIQKKPTSNLTIQCIVEETA